MKRIFVVALAVAAMLGAGEAQAQKKTLVIGMGSADAGKLDPHIASTTPDKGLLQYIFNGLVRIRPGQISPDTIEPDLAESWTSNPTAAPNGPSRSARACNAIRAMASSPPRTRPIRSSAPPTRRPPPTPTISRASTRRKPSTNTR